MPLQIEANEESVQIILSPIGSDEEIGSTIDGCPQVQYIVSTSTVYVKYWNGDKWARKTLKVPKGQGPVKERVTKAAKLMQSFYDTYHVEGEAGGADDEEEL